MKTKGFVEELRSKTSEELYKELVTGKKELFNLRFQNATNQLDNTARINEVRKNIARIQTIMAQNALLKILEEPPAGVYLILTAVSRAKLLETVISRLTILTLPQIDESGKYSPPAARLIRDIADKRLYDCLKTITAITADRNNGASVLKETRRTARDILAYKVGNAAECDTAAASRLTLEQTVRLCDLLEQTVRKLEQNANQNILTVWFTNQIENLNIS